MLIQVSVLPAERLAEQRDGAQAELVADLLDDVRLLAGLPVVGSAIGSRRSVLTHYISSNPVTPK